MPCFFKKIGWQSLLYGKMNLNIHEHVIAVLGEEPKLLVPCRGATLPQLPAPRRHLVHLQTPGVKDPTIAVEVPEETDLQEEVQGLTTIINAREEEQQEGQEPDHPQVPKAGGGCQGAGAVLPGQGRRSSRRQ